MSDTKYCKDCKNINCPEGRVNCEYPDAIACAFYRDTPPTVFETITASPEVLAEKLVYQFIGYDGNGLFHGYWKSTITDEDYATKEKAIAATVEKLKEVENG